MKLINAKKELKSFKTIERMIDQHSSWINDRKLSANKVTASLSNEPKGMRKHNDAMAENLVKVLDVEEESEAMIRELELKKKLIYNKIMRLEQPYQDILFNIYIIGRTTESCANVIGYSLQHTWKLKSDAVKLYAKQK